jgi:hypothetical protein
MENCPDKPFELDLPERGGASIALIGSTRAGKSHCLIQLLNKYFKSHCSVLMTGSPQAPIYKEAPKHIIQAPQYCPRIIKDMSRINKETNNHYDFLAVLDDIVTGVKFDKEIIKLLCVYRNSNCSTIISAQAITLLNTAGRTNINFVCLFKLNSEEQIEKVIKAYLSSYFPVGMKMLDKIRHYRLLTEDHHFFVVDNYNGGVFRTKCDAK